MKKRRVHKIQLSYKAKRRIVFTISLVVLGILFLLRSVSYVIVTLSSIALLAVFYISDHLFDLRFKPRHYFIATFIAVTGFLLFDLYSIYPLYDKILHFTLPMMASSVFFHMIYELDLKLKWTLVFTFFVVSGLVGLFEIAEYSLDLAFDFNLQGVYIKDIFEAGTVSQIQDPIDDTMIDMGLGMIGSLLYTFYIAILAKRQNLVKKYH